MSARGEEGRGGRRPRGERRNIFCTSTRSVAGRRRITARGAGVVPGRAGGAGDAPVFERDAHGVDGNASAGAGFAGRIRARRRLTARRGSAACGERVTVPFPAGRGDGRAGARARTTRGRERDDRASVATAGDSHERTRGVRRRRRARAGVRRERGENAPTPDAARARRRTGVTHERRARLDERDPDPARVGTETTVYDSSFKAIHKEELFRDLRPRRPVGHFVASFYR